MGGIRQKPICGILRTTPAIWEHKENLEPPIRDTVLGMIFVLELHGELRGRKKSGRTECCEFVKTFKTTVKLKFIARYF